MAANQTNMNSTALTYWHVRRTRITRNGVMKSAITGAKA
jgi:hypothetical protein